PDQHEHVVERRQRVEAAELEPVDAERHRRIGQDMDPGVAATRQCRVQQRLALSSHRARHQRDTAGRPAGAGGRRGECRLDGGGHGEDRTDSERPTKAPAMMPRIAPGCGTLLRPLVTKYPTWRSSPPSIASNSPSPTPTAATTTTIRS